MSRASTITAHAMVMMSHIDGTANPCRLTVTVVSNRTVGVVAATDDEAAVSTFEEAAHVRTVIVVTVLGVVVAVITASLAIFENRIVVAVRGGIVRSCDDDNESINVTLLEIVRDGDDDVDGKKKSILVITVDTVDVDGA